MDLPDPEPGMVIGYAYLWRNEALAGREEGRKDRPCVIVISTFVTGGQRIVTVAPITHSPPDNPEWAIELPAETKRRLGLDERRSWVVATDLNRFTWPGVDLRPIRRGARNFLYGRLPASLFRDLKDRLLVLVRTGGVAVTSRSD